MRTRSGTIDLSARNGSLGQSLAEFALMLPFFLLTLVIALDFGRVFLGWVQLNNMARIAANYAAQHPDAWTSGNTSQQAAYQSLVQDDAGAIDCTLPSPLPTPAFPAGDTLGAPARVQLSCSFQLITPLAGGIVGNPLTVSASAVFPIRTGVVAGVPGASSIPSPTPSPTPAPTATATPSTSPSPTPTPMCTVPKFIGTNSANAQATWTAAGFTTTVIFSPVRPPEYVINDQSLAAGSSVACNTGITVYDKHQ
jgi:Flp pilus assembly protein TadG